MEGSDTRELPYAESGPLGFVLNGLGEPGVNGTIDGIHDGTTAHLK